MKRIENKEMKNNFIGSWIISNDNLFKNLINFFEKNQNLQKQGTVGGGINLSIKKTKDIKIDPKDLEKEEYLIFKEYMSELFKCYSDYKDQWPFIKQIFKSVDIPSFNLQRYLPGDHFQEFTQKGALLFNLCIEYLPG